MKLQSRQQIIQELRELIVVPLLHPELYSNMGIPPPRGILLYGVTGTGKTFLIRQAAEDAKANLYPINIGGMKEAELLNEVRYAEQNLKPVVIYLVMHNPDAITNQITNTLNKILDGEAGIDLNHMIFAGSSVKPSLPSELRRAGRFDKELHIRLPDQDDRLSIIQNLVKKISIKKDLDLDFIAQNTKGYTPADLQQLFKVAARMAIRRKFSDQAIEPKENITLGIEDVKDALDQVEPTVFYEFGFTNPSIQWESLAGHHEIKKQILENIVQPIKFKSHFQKAGVSRSTGVLLYGPPGNGKTTIAKAIASASNSHFLYINSAELVNEDGEQKLNQIFEIALEVGNTLLFFDEADVMLSKRQKKVTITNKLVNSFLTIMDGVLNLDDIIIVAATNFLDHIDEAVARPGRLELKIFVPPPDFEGRKETFELLTKNQSLGESVKFEELAELTNEGDKGMYSFADLDLVVREAGVLAARESINSGKDSDEVMVGMSHFRDAIKRIQPSIEDVSIYQKN